MTVSELRSTEILALQTKKQLEFTYKQLSEIDVDYVVVPQDRVGYIVKREFFLSAILDELSFREGEEK